MENADRKKRDARILFFQILLCVFLLGAAIIIRYFPQDTAVPSGAFGAKAAGGGMTFSDLADLADQKVGQSRFWSRFFFVPDQGAALQSHGTSQVVAGEKQP